MITITTSGSFKNIEGFLRRTKRQNLRARLESFGARGVRALQSVTPKDTGVTAGSWNYRVSRSGDSYTLSWTNSSMGGTTPIVILLQYGHGNGKGGYVSGRDFINPAIRPVFDEIANSIWDEVSR